MIAEIASGLGAIYGLATSAKRKASQRADNDYERQKQIEGAKELTDYQKQKDLEMFKETSPVGMIDDYKRAGISPALMYGMGGAGGATTGGSGGMPARGQIADSNQGEANDINRMIGLSQIALMQAQAKKTETEAEVIGGAGKQKTMQDTKESEERTKNQEFQNKLNAKIGLEDMLWNFKASQTILQTTKDKQVDEYNAWRAAAFADNAYQNSDYDSPMAKAYRAGMGKTVQELETAKTEGDIKKAEKIIEEFEAKMTESGISPKSPWYVKFIGDILDKVGLNPFTNK